MIRTGLIAVLGLVYDVVAIPLILVFIPLSFFSENASRYRISRNSVFKLIATLRLSSRESVLFYCSSVGELEQGIPLIDLVEKGGRRPVVFFHSLNGYAYCKATTQYEAYMLPYDTFVGWCFLLASLKPRLFIINRHEFWPGAVLAASLLSRLYVINYVVKDHISLFERCVISCCNKVFSVNEARLILEKIVHAGDTRIDRLAAKYIAKKQEIATIRETLRGGLCLGQRLAVIGNCYNEDLAVLKEAGAEIFADYKFLVVPSRKGVDASGLVKTAQVTEVQVLDWRASNIVVLHTMGNLFEIYGSADIAWVGGGCSVGIHNCLEPDFYGIPIISGPNLNQQADAIQLKEKGSLHTFKDSRELLKVLNICADTEKVASQFQSDYSPAQYIYTSIYESNYSR
jgi:3-deoxy-D-manno-octulosonic-acid transferase